MKVEAGIITRAGDQVGLRAVFMRGGASKALVFRSGDLPADPVLRDRLFLAAMGSPDPYGRQLDGMGGGISSLSKVCIVGPSTRPDADIDYVFGQVEVRRAEVDYNGRCGSMASAMGPFAVDEGLVSVAQDGEVAVRIHDVNVGRIIVSRFRVRGGRAAVEGDYVVEGVAGTGAPVRMEFEDPGGGATGRLLPMGEPLSEIDVPDFGTLPYSFVDSANPVMFVEAARVGLSGAEQPSEIEAIPGLLDRIETLRRSVAVAFGAAPDLAAAGSVSLPRIAFVAAPSDYTTLAGKTVEAGASDIMIRMIGRGIPHRSVPVTTALCLATACRIPGTIPGRLVRSAARGAGVIRVAHPSGVWETTARVSQTPQGPRADSAGVAMTARRLFAGEVMVPARLLGAPAGA
jgi:2-methylaconitate cis-trans-isomerase PrpF